MGAIKSDITGASQKATALKKATDKLVKSSSVTTDTQTTVTGNTNALEAIKLAQQTSQQIAQAISSASANIQSVAQNFEALDQKTSQNFTKSLGGFK